MARHKHEAINKHIGAQLRARRKSLEISRQKIGDVLDVSYQQIQKFETGKNDLSAAQLYILAYQLQIPLSYFFEVFPIKAVVGKI